MVPEISDERLGSATTIVRLLRRPEMGAASGAVLVFVLFLLVANAGMFSARGIMNWVEVSAQLGVIAISACLLMIAGEFDLSVGSMIAFSGMIIALLIKYAGLPPWVAILLGFMFC